MRNRPFVKRGCALRGGAGLALCDDHRLDRGHGAAGNLDLDHVGADRLDRLGQTNRCLLDADATGILDRVGDVLSGDGAEEATVFAGLLLNAIVGWAWADPVAALVIAAIAVREGRNAWRGDPCC